MYVFNGMVSPCEHKPFSQLQRKAEVMVTTVQRCPCCSEMTYFVRYGPVSFESWLPADHYTVRSLDKLKYNKSEGRRCMVLSLYGLECAQEMVKVENVD